MPGPERGDYLIRDSADAREFLLVDATAFNVISGPYTSIADAARDARRLSSTATVWRENLDERGRALGEPFRLPIVGGDSQISTGRIHTSIADIVAAQDFDALLVATRHAARSLTRADGVTFVLRAGDCCHYVDEDAIGPLWKGQRFPMSQCVSGWVMRNKQSVVIPDIYSDPRIPLEAYRTTFVRSLVMVPVRKEDPIAAIGAYWQAPTEPAAEHVRIIELLADAAATRLGSGQLHGGIRE